MSSPTSAWPRALIGLGLALAALLALYFGAAASMVEIWNRSETFAHAYVVPPISLWLIWRRRHDLAALTPKASPIWLLAVLASSFMWLAGDMVNANSVTQFGFTFMLIALVPTVLGTHVAARIAFPLGFLLFAVPFGDFLTPWLMDRTADFTILALRATGIPVYREGLSFIIPSGSWSVVQACSGIRYLMASVMVGTLFAYLNYQSSRKRWAFVAVSIVTPLIANWLRAYMIVILGHVSGNTLAVGVDHLIYGWVFFGIIMFVMFMAGARWADPDPQADLVAGSMGMTQPGARQFLVTLAALCVLALPLGLREHGIASGPQGKPELKAPSLAGWQWRAEPLSDWRPDYVNPAASVHGQLTREGAVPVGLYVGYYRHQRPGAKLLTSTNALVDPEVNKVWAFVSVGLRSEEIGGGKLDFRTAELRGEPLDKFSGRENTAGRVRVWHSYWVGGRPFVRQWQATLYGAWLRLLGQGDDAAVVIFYVRATTPKADEATLRDFAQTQWPALDTWLRGVRATGESR